MRPILFILGFLLTIYVIAEWLQGTIQYSFEGWIGGSAFAIANQFSPNFMAKGSFLDIVYVLTLVIGIAMIFLAMVGGKK
ncbi:MAG: hypothetical protein QXR73_02955 [Candidatus Micrarchaeaceae archaeon]